MTTGTDTQLIHIAIVEDDPLRQVGLHAILDPLPGFEVKVLPVSALSSDNTIDVVLLGNYSGHRFLEAMASLRVLRPNLPVIVTGAGTDDEAVLKALGCGAKAYVDETGPTAHLVQAIQAVCEGSVWAPRRVLSMFIERFHDSVGSCQPGSRITPREKEVLQMLVEGRSNKEIGVPLGIEERTVKAHIAKLMRKVGVHNRIELSVQAVSQSLVSAGG